MLKKLVYILTAVLICIFNANIYVNADYTKNIEYHRKSNNALDSNGNGNTLRFNIYNVWTAQIEDIDPDSKVCKFIEITFTISGLGDKHCNLKNDGSPDDNYTISLLGDTQNDCFLNRSSDTVIPGKIEITGDGTYKVRTELKYSSEQINCLFLSSNINFYQLGDDILTANDCNVNIDIESITTSDENYSSNYDFILGDADKDGNISISDATLILNEYACVAAGLNASFDERAFKASDVNGDEKITITDATSVLKYYAANAAGIDIILSEYFPAANKYYNF